MAEKSGRSDGYSSQQSRISCSSRASLVVSSGGTGGRNGGISPPLTRTKISVNAYAAVNATLPALPTTLIKSCLVVYPLLKFSIKSHTITFRVKFFTNRQKQITYEIASTVDISSESNNTAWQQWTRQFPRHVMWKWLDQRSEPTICWTQIKCCNHWTVCTAISEMLNSLLGGIGSSSSPQRNSPAR